MKNTAFGGKGSEHIKKIFGRENVNYKGPKKASHHPIRSSLNDVKSDFVMNKNISNEPPIPERTEKFCYAASQWLVENLDVDGLICVTIHGSYLYGTAHEKSDVDFFAVYHNDKKKKNKHKKVGNLDVQLHSLDTFLKNIEEGATNASETLYSPYLTFVEDSPYKEMVLSLKPSKYKMIKKMSGAKEGYLDTAERIAERDPYKSQKCINHAKRMEDSIDKLLEGNWSPVWKPFGE